jgi:hypothetical protein
MLEQQSGELADGVDIVPQPASARTTAAPHTLRSNFVELIIGVSKPWVLLRCRRLSSGMAHHITYRTAFYGNGPRHQPCLFLNLSSLVPFS